MALTKKNLMPPPQEEECKDGGIYKPMMCDESKPQLMASTMQANPLSYKPKQKKKKSTADSIWAKGFASRFSK
jgi:hypothetical protein